MSTTSRASRTTPQNTPNASEARQYSTRSKGPIRVPIRKKSRGHKRSAREKVDILVGIIRDEFNWTVPEFVKHYITQEPERPSDRSPEWRRNKLFASINEGITDWPSVFSGAGIPFSAFAPAFGNTLRVELDTLIQVSRYFGPWQPEVDPTSIDMGAANLEISRLAPELTSFLRGLCAHQRASWDVATSQQTQGFRILTIVSLACSGRARNTSDWFQTTIGLHLSMLGTKRRVIELLHALGLAISYHKINDRLDIIANRARAIKALLRTSGKRSDMFIGYDNFDWMGKVKHKTMGAASEQKTATTGRVYFSDYLPASGLLQSQLNTDIPLTLPDIYCAPGVQHDSIYRDVCLSAICDTVFAQFAETLDANLRSLCTQIPMLEQLEPTKTETMVLDAMFENEGTIDGTYNVHNLLTAQLGLDQDKDFSKRLIIVVGDQKTSMLIRSVQTDQAEAERDYDKRRWLLGLPALFHWRMNRLWGTQRSYSGPVQCPSSATLASHMNFWKVTQVPLNKAPFHHIEELALQSWDARVLALLYKRLADDGLDVSNLSQVRQYIAYVGASGIQTLASQIYDEAFTSAAYKGSPRFNEDGSTAPIDHEYLTHIRYLQDLIPYKAMVHGIRTADIGHIERSVNASIFLSAGIKAHNYAYEMVRWRWLVSKAADPVLRKAMYACSICNRKGKSDSWIEVDLNGELLNGDLKTCLYDKRSSTYTPELLLRRTALVQDYFISVRDPLERGLGIRPTGHHTRRSAVTQIHVLAVDLATSSVRQQADGRHLGFDAPNVMGDGSTVIDSYVTRLNADRYANYTQPELEPIDEPTIETMDMPRDANVTDIEAVINSELATEDQYDNDHSTNSEEDTQTYVAESPDDE